MFLKILERLFGRRRKESDINAFEENNLAPNRRGRGLKLNIVLFVVTCLTTFGTAFLISGGSVTAGLWFSAGIITILFSHEMGHYLMCRKYGVRATLPYFIPFPPLINPFNLASSIWLNPFGTMGAVIRMEGRMQNRRVLFDIGAGGPLAGLVPTLLALFWGLMMSTPEVHSAETPQATLILGKSLVFELFAAMAGKSFEFATLESLHPLAFAGWAGLFITALNLFPVGQLDGGHVLYALMGEKSNKVYPVLASVFILIALSLYPGWIPLILLLMFFRIEHPPTLQTVTPLDPVRKALAVFLFVVFIFSFTPMPFLMY